MGKGPHSQYEEPVSILGFLILLVQALELDNHLLPSFLSNLDGPGTGRPKSNIYQVNMEIYFINCLFDKNSFPQKIYWTTFSRNYREADVVILQYQGQFSDPEPIIIHL